MGFTVRTSTVRGTDTVRGTSAAPLDRVISDALGIVDLVSGAGAPLSPVINDALGLQDGGGAGLTHPDRISLSDAASYVLTPGTPDPPPPPPPAANPDAVPLPTGPLLPYRNMAAETRRGPEHTNRQVDRNFSEIEARVQEGFGALDSPGWVTSGRIAAGAIDALTMLGLNLFNLGFRSVGPTAVRYTESTSYVNWPVDEAVQISGTKDSATSRILVLFTGSVYAGSSQAFQSHFAIRVTEGDLEQDLTTLWVEADSPRKTVVGITVVEGLTAGDKTYTLRAKITSVGGSPRLQTDTLTTNTLVVLELP